MKKLLIIMLIVSMLRVLFSCAPDPGDISRPEASSAETSSVETSKDDSSAEASKEASSAEASKEASSAEASKEASSAEASKEASSAEASKEASSAEASKEASSAEASKEASSAEASKEASSAEISKETSSAEASSEQPNDNVPDESHTRSNIALGKLYTTTGADARTDKYGDFEENGVCRYKLTDGVTASSGETSKIAGYSNSKNTLSVVLDLDGDAWIWSLTTDYFGGLWGVPSPDKLRVEYYAKSANGYTMLGSVSPAAGTAKTFTANGWTGCNFTLNLKKPVKTSQIKVIYTLTGTNEHHFWSSEIQAVGYMIGSPSIKTDDVPSVKIYTDATIYKDDYVDCEIYVTDPSGKYGDVHDMEATIKVRGNSTSSGAKKPYNVKFSSKVDLLGMGKCKKWYLLANMYDKSLIRNKLAYDFAADLGLDYTQESCFANLYLNGQYMGCYQVCESIGVGDSRVDIDIDDNDFLLEYEPWPGYSNVNYIYTPSCNILFGFNDPEEPTDAQRTWLSSFLMTAETALRGGDYKEICKYWDVESFVNDYITHEYFKCVDAQTSSTRYYIKDGVIYGGPVWDFDLSSGNANPDYYTSYYSGTESAQGWWCRSLWYKYFFRTDWFEDMVIERFKEIQPIIENLTTDNELGDNRIDALLEQYGNCFTANYTTAGWNIKNKDSDYEMYPLATYNSNISFLRNWLIRRNAWMCDQWGIK